MLALLSRTREEKLHFKKFMHTAAERFWCKGCSEHFKQYLKDHPINVDTVCVDENGDDIAMFSWTVDFHNSVNERLGKFHNIITVETAIGKYNGSSGDKPFCTASGGSSETKKGKFNFTPNFSRDRTRRN
jgi:hypothetical protein